MFEDFIKVGKLKKFTFANPRWQLGKEPKEIQGEQGSTRNPIASLK